MRASRTTTGGRGISWGPGRGDAMNRFNTDDPRLTAFALGELDPDEAALIEPQMASAASLRSAAELIRQTASMLTTELTAEPAPELTEAQRQLIHERPEPVLRSPWIFRAKQIWMGVGLAAAACLTFAVFVMPSLSKARRSS